MNSRNPFRRWKVKIIVRFLLIVLLILISRRTFAQDIDFAWVRSAGGSKLEYGRAISADRYGNCFVTGLFKELAYFDGQELTSSGGDDIFIAKYNANGELVWVRKAGGPNADYGLGITTDGDGNCFVTGSFFGEIRCGSLTIQSNGALDIFIAKYDSMGNLEWAKGAGGDGYDRGFSIAVDDAGNPVLTGFFNSTAHFDHIDLVSEGQTDIFVAKYDAQGRVVWARRAGGSESDEGYGIAVDESNGCTVTGYFRRAASFENILLNSEGAEDIFIAKYDATGRLKWIRQAGGRSSDIANDIDLDCMGNSFITGSFGGSAAFGTTQLSSDGGGDIFVAKYDYFGNVVWAKNAGGPNDDVGRGIAADGFGGCVTTGEFVFDARFDTISLVSNGQRDVYIARYDRGGDVLWVKGAGGASSDVGDSISRNPWHHYFITGHYVDTSYFDSFMLQSEEYADIFIAKLIDSTYVADDLDPFSDVTAPVLFQNRPNPFNAESLIQYYLSRAGRVTITLFDLRGREIRTLVKDDKQPGMHATAIQGSDLSSGMYICRLKIDGHILSKKIVFSK